VPPREHVRGASGGGSSGGVRLKKGEGSEYTANGYGRSVRSERIKREPLQNLILGKRKVRRPSQFLPKEEGQPRRADF